MNSELLLAVWREIGREIRLERSAARLGRILTEVVGSDRLVIGEFDWLGRRLVRRGDSLKAPRMAAAVGHPLDPADMRRLRAWMDADEEALVRAAPGNSLPAQLLVHGQPGQWVTVPLAGERSVDGALLVSFPEGSPLDGVVPAALLALREPFAAALLNDRLYRDARARNEHRLGGRRSPDGDGEDVVERIIGEDRGLQEVLRRVELVAHSDIPVLILGETGSGKEAIARRIHEWSDRGEKPFLRVNCGAIPTELIDSELFGHTKGAFTGAAGVRKGLFERADGGTLLLDEVGELPLLAQVRLLRVLQEGTFQPVGGERDIRVNVRIVAATHRNLPAMVHEGRFREDLWYRIGGFPITIPPLRDRKEDLPALVDHFVDRAARRFGLRPLAMRSEDLAALLEYEWPGNIRELASVIDRAAILGAGETLEIEKALGSGLLTRRSQVREGVTQPADGGPPTATLDEVARRHIERVLAACRGRIEGNGGAAAVLAVNPHTLRARMKKMGIDWALFR